MNFIILLVLSLFVRPILAQSNDWGILTPQISFNSSLDTNTILHIGSVEISKQEFMAKMSLLRSKCFDHFLQKGLVYGSPSYWNHQMGDTTPMQWLMGRTLEQLTEEKLMLSVIQMYGVLEGFNYREFKKSLEQENTKRLSLVQEGKVIYGLHQFDESSFFEYTLSNAILETERRIVNSSPYSEKELREYYNSQKDLKFKIPNTVEVDILIAKNNNFMDSTIYHIRNEIVQKKPLDKILNSYNGAITIQRALFSPGSSKGDELKYGVVFSKAILFNEANETSDVFTDMEDRKCLLVCKRIQMNGFIPFDDVRDLVKIKLAKEKFNLMLAKKKREVFISINERLWNNIVYQ